MLKIMKPNEVRGELIRRGIRLTDIAKMTGESRQLVWLAIETQPENDGRTAKIWQKIKELIRLQ